MHIGRRRGWDIPERLLTPEHFFFNRRGFLAGAGALAFSSGAAKAQRISDLVNLADPTSDLYPAKRNEKYVLDRAITSEQLNAHYNNFYEFNSSKEVAEQAQKLSIRPWTVKIDGLVENDDLFQKLGTGSRTETIYKAREQGLLPPTPPISGTQ